MHEHHAVHELHVVLRARVENTLQFCRIEPTWFLAHDVLAGFGGFDHPFGADAGRQRNVYGVDVFCCDQFFVTSDRSRCLWKRYLRGAVSDELFRTLKAATGHGREHGVLRTVN